MTHSLGVIDPVTEEALEALGGICRHLRHERGLGQRTLASRAGVSQGTISKLENGLAAWMTLRTFARVIAALDFAPGDFGFTPRPARPGTPTWLAFQQGLDIEHREAVVGQFERARLARLGLLEG